MSQLNEISDWLRENPPRLVAEHGRRLDVPVPEDEDKTWSSVVSYSLPTGEQYVHMSVRATPKVS